MKPRNLALSLVLLASLTGVGVAVAKDSKYGGIKDMAKQQANGYASEKLGIPSTAPAGAKVYIVSPKDGDTVSSPVTVVFGLKNAGIAPAGTQVEGTGHHHLLIDDPQPDLAVPLPNSDKVVHFGKGQTETDLKLAPGTHTLQLVFGDWKHQSFNPTVQSDKITITVK